MLKSSLKIALVALAIPLLLNVQAEAKNKGKVPKDAVALSAEEVKAIYVDKTFTFQPTPIVYFNTDGTLSGVDIMKGHEGFIDGTWKIDGNEMCTERHFHVSDKTKNGGDAECRKFSKVGKVVYTQYVKGWDVFVGDVMTGFDKIATPGDAVSAKVEALHKKFGY